MRRSQYDKEDPVEYDPEDDPFGTMNKTYMYYIDEFGEK